MQDTECKMEVKQDMDKVKLLFLGTGAGDFRAMDNLNNQNEHIVRARQLGGRNLRHAAAAMIFPDILIDFYDDRQIRNLDVETDAIRHLLITHGHWDHFQPEAILEFAARLPHVLQVYGNAMVGDALEFVATYAWDESTGRFSVREMTPNICFHLIRPGQRFELKDTTITAVQGNHYINKQHMIMDQWALNYILECAGRTIFYGLDSSYTLPLTMEHLRQFHLDLAVFDATFGDKEIDTATSGHNNFAMLADTIAEFRQEGIIGEGTTVVGSHISLEHVRPHDDIVEDLARNGIVLAYDGMIWEG